MPRHDPRAMRPDAYDPWQHNRDQATLRAMRRLGRSAQVAARRLRRFSLAVERFALKLRAEILCQAADELRRAGDA